MAALSDFVQLSISVGGTPVTRQGFESPLILTFHTRFADTYRIYTSLAGMLADGFTSYDDAYRIAAAVFRQNPTVQRVVVGRLTVAPAFTTRVTVTSATEGEYIRFKVIEPATGVVQQVERLIPGASSVSAEATAIALLTEALAGVDSTATGANIDVTPTVAGRKVHVYDLENCTLTETTAAQADYTAKLSAMLLQPVSWYGVLIDSASVANVNAVTTWVTSQKKLFVASTSDTGYLGSSSYFASGARTAHMYAVNSHEFAGASWMGVGLTLSPGAVPWANKQLVGVTAVSLTTTQQNFIEGGYGNHLQPLNGIAVVRLGTLSTGRFVDLQHGQDVLEARIQEDLYGLIANAPKIPYTPAGDAMIEATILGTLQTFEGTRDLPGFVVENSSSVQFSDISSVPISTKQSRIRPGVTFTATLEGAVNKIQVVGTLVD